jgi:hypothetical protein
MNKLEIQFGLRGIKTNQFAIIENSFDENKSIRLRVDYNFGIDVKEKMVSAVVSVDFLADDVTFVTIEVECFFEIIDAVWSSLIKKNKFELPLQLTRHMAAVSLSSCRGVLHEKLKDTKFAHLFIPLINVHEALTSKVTFNLE